MYENDPTFKRPFVLPRFSMLNEALPHRKEETLMEKNIAKPRHVSSAISNPFSGVVVVARMTRAIPLARR